MSGPTNATIQNWGGLKSPMKGALEGANKSLDGILTAHSRDSANIFKQANTEYLKTWKDINSSSNKFMTMLVGTVLAKVQENLLKKQLQNEKDIANEKRDLIQQQIDLAKKARDDWNSTYKPLEADFVKTARDGLKKAYKPNYDFIAGRMGNYAMSAFAGQEQKIKETTSPYSTGGLAYKLAVLSIAKAGAVADASNKGYIYEDNKKIRLDKDSLDRIERTSVQANAVKVQGQANFAQLSSMLQPNVAGAYNAYASSIGTLAGSLVNLFGSFGNNGGTSGSAQTLDGFSSDQSDLLMW